MRPHNFAIFIISLAILLAACVWGFYDGRQLKAYEQSHYVIRYDKSIFHSKDTLRHYAALAKEGDPVAMAITGTASFIFQDDVVARDTLPIVSTDEGAVYLLKSADLRDLDAMWVIKCLHYHQLWPLEYPEYIDEYYQ